MPHIVNIPLEQLAAAALLIQPPDSYFRGVGTVSGGVENIVCFHRATLAALQEGSARYVHHRYVLILSCTGAGTVGIQDQLHEIAAGEALLIRPHQIHYFPRVEGPSFCWLFATFECPARKLAFSSHVIGISERARLYIAMLCEAYIASRTRREAHEDVSAWLGLLLRELTRVSRSRARPRKQPRDELIDRVVNYVYTHLEEEVSVQETAEKIGMSESHLRREFRLRSGQSLGNFIKRARIARATALLVESSLSIGEVASRCGYTSIYSFSRAFTLAVGRSPSLYRKKKGAG